MTKTTTRTDIYARVTDRIISDLEHGVRPWLRPWHASHTDGRITLPRRHDGTPYRGINILLLWAEMIDECYASDTWMTFRQALALKAHVRKGEHGSTVVYADRVTKTETNDRGEDVEQEIPFLKAYTVFNVEQIEGLPASYHVQPERTGEPLALIARAEAFFAATGATIRHGGSRAYYAPGPDVIQLPPAEAFRDAESYAATKAHELTQNADCRIMLRRLRVFPESEGIPRARCGVIREIRGNARSSSSARYLVRLDAGVAVPISGSDSPSLWAMSYLGIPRSGRPVPLRHRLSLVSSWNDYVTGQVGLAFV